MRNGFPWKRPLLALVFSAGLVSGQPGKPALTLVVSSETAPSGGWIQLKVRLQSPRQVTAGSISMDLDPSVFGPIANVAVFSATGDAAGFAHVNATHVDAQFSSPSGGVGQLPDVPVFVVSVPVLVGLPKAKAVSLTVKPQGSDWCDTSGNAYAVDVVPGTFAVGGSSSIQSVFPGGGLLPLGTVVRVTGSGLDQSTTIAMEGVSIRSVDWISENQVNFTLGGATEITGKRLRLKNADGEAIDYFLAMPSAPSDWQSSVQLLVPLTTYQTVQWYFAFNHPLSRQLAGLLNQTLTPVNATFFGVYGGAVIVLKTITVPPGELYFPSIYDLLPPPAVYLTVSAPIRMLEFSSNFRGGNPLFVETALAPTPVFKLPDLDLVTSSEPIVWNWQTGSAPPSGMSVGLSYPAAFSVAVSPSARQWLGAKPTQGTSPETLTLTPNVSSLGPGTYSGSVDITYSLAPPLSTITQTVTLGVTLNIYAAPFVKTSNVSGIQFSVPLGGSPPNPKVVGVDSSGAPTPFTAIVTTNSGGNWLKATPSKSTTPGDVAITVEPRGLGLGQYEGQVTIKGEANGFALPVVLNIVLPAGDLSVDPSIMEFVFVAGASSNPYASSQAVFVRQGAISRVSVRTDSGSWLDAIAESKTALRVSVNAVGLKPGSYAGSVLATSTTNSSLQIPVTLTVLDPPAAPLTVKPPGILGTIRAGENVAQLLDVESMSGGPALFQWTSSVTGAAVVVGTLSQSAITAQRTYGAQILPVTPATLQVELSATQPGTYRGSIDIAWDGGSVRVPVTLNVTATPALPPLVATIVNAASEAPSALAPGEMLTIFGQGIGAAPAGFTLDANGEVPREINGTQVLIDGKPAPLLYADASQINAIVPYEIDVSRPATLQVVSNGLASATWGLAVAASAPGVFTARSAGVGQASVLNQDNSGNDASNPAARGTVAQIFATGGGQTIPAGATGSIAARSGDTTVRPVTVSIGGIESAVSYHGSAPGEIAGLMQVNAEVPPGVTPGPAVPIVISVGGQPSQGGVTMAVK